jgi:hypothetical protein
VSTVNGFGTGTCNSGGPPAPNNCVRVFSNVDANVGSDITYNPDVVNGDSFLINTDGVYAIGFQNIPATSSEHSGITVNADPGVAILLLPTTNRLCVNTTADGDVHGCSVTVILKVGDVIRAHVTVADDSNGIGFPHLGSFTITRVN